MTAPALAPRQRLPRILECGVDETPALAVYQGATVAHPTAAGSTYTLTDDSGAVVFSGPVAVDSEGVASVTVGGAFTRDKPYSDRWLEEWALIFDGKTHRIRSDAMNVRRKLYNVVSQDDLKRRHPQIVAEQLAPENTDFSGVIEEAFEQFERDLIEKGNRPNLIVSPWSCRSCVLALALAYIFRDAITNANGETDRFRDLFKDYQAEYVARFPKLTYRIDADEDGTVSEQRPSATPVLFLSSTPRAGRTGLAE